jgi:hypothetical protein
MLGKDEFEHDLSGILKYRIWILRDGLKFGDHTGATMLDVPRHRLKIDRDAWGRPIMTGPTMNGG